MGRVIQQLVAGRTDCMIAAGVDLFADSAAAFPAYTNIADVQEEADVIIDFSHPSLLTPILSYAAQKGGIPAVLCTTGYSAEQVEALKTAAQTQPVFYSRNMSLGINLLIELSKKAAKVLGDQFDIEIIEKHHNRKLDAPSGTALMLADAISEELAQPPQYVYDRHSRRAARSKEEIGIHSVRGGTIVGEHEILFAGHDETLSLTHTAMSKEIFATGAINAAIFLAKQQPGLYNMGDLV